MTEISTYYYKEHGGSLTHKKDNTLTLHREGGPAHTQVMAGGVLMRELWYQNGLCHRDDDGPAITHKETGRESFIWMKEGKIHRDQGPAIIELIFNLKTTVKNTLISSYDKKNPADKEINVFYKEGKFIAGAPYVKIYNSKKELIEYKLYHGINNKGKPFSESFDQNHQLLVQEWRNKHDAYHREDGPARIIYQNGEIKITEWWLEGKKINDK